MDIQDIIFNSSVGMSLKTAILEVMEAEQITNPYTKVLIPTDANDDVNGSQHALNGGNDFTYREADEDDVERASTLGYYEYFSGYGSQFTGHYYNGDERHFPAIVIDPPAYAVSHYI